VLLIILCPLALAQEKPALRLPFHSVRSLTLVFVMVDGAPKNLIFDTGAERTLVNSRDGNVERRVTFALGSKVMGNFPIILTDLSGMSMEKVGADGVLGEDVLRKFSAVRIDYKAGVVEFEK
jgi:hypothetical protein